MTQTITTPPAPAAAPAPPPHPSDILMNLIISLLMPMFLCGAEGDTHLARLAVIETMNTYRARNQADLIAIAQIIACGLATLGSLGLSMADNHSLTMTLRLRGNAVALSRIAEQIRRRLKETPKDGPMPDQPAEHVEPQCQAALQPPAAEPEAPVSTSRAAPAVTPAPKTQVSPADQKSTVEQLTITAAIETLKAWPPSQLGQRRPVRSAAKLDAAGQIAAAISNLAPADRNAASMTVLTSTASSLLPSLDGPPLKPIIRGLGRTSATL